ncbi:hypothetical protein DXG03_001303, partial [Asterophora parasitica]
MSAPPATSGSPIKHNPLTGYESRTTSLSTYRGKLNKAMSGFFVGPMPVDQFLQEFLPSSTRRTPKIPKDEFKTVPINGAEDSMYPPFMKIIQDRKLIPNYKIVNTSHTPDRQSVYNMKPDPTIYRDSFDISGGATNFAELELSCELKPKESYDAFRDPTPHDDLLTFEFENTTKHGNDTRSQIAHYATETLARQHRSFFFSVLIAGAYMRFIRWDRAGAIVTERFNYRDNCHDFVEFLWRYTHLDDAARGLDPTVRRATEQEARLARTALHDWKPQQLDRPLVVFTVPGIDGKPREFIAWASMTEPDTVTGRCTRAYPVFEIASGKRYFLKDSWRASDLNPEGEILKVISEKVARVPRFLCGGDILNDVTLTDLFVPGLEEEENSNSDPAGAQNSATDDDPGLFPAPPPLPDKRNFEQWLCGNSWSHITHRIHHRFVVDFIGRPIKTFKSSKQLVQVAYDAYTAYREVYNLFKILHRDISAMNILIDAEGRGVLNDWDLAKEESKLKHGRRHERT